MYEQFFNLKAKPFDLVPNPEFLFLSKGHKKAITYLDYGIREKVGFILLTGEVGSGKTTILRNLIKEVKEQIVLSKIFNTKVTSDQLIAMINEDFGLQVSGKDKVALLRDLYEFLIEQYAIGCQPILIIDEAQNLSAELLEEVRMLSNLESDRAKLLQIVLVGQPELRATLAGPELTQLRQRISLTCHLKPLTEGEVTQYIYHRLAIAGNRDAVVLPDETFELIYQFSRGIPRLVNIICDFLMISAFVEQTREISVELVREVVGELEEDNRYWAGNTPQSSRRLALEDAGLARRIERLEGLADDRSLDRRVEMLETLADDGSLEQRVGLLEGAVGDGALAQRVTLLEQGLQAVAGACTLAPEAQDPDGPRASAEQLASLESCLNALALEHETQLKALAASQAGLQRELQAVKENAQHLEELSQAPIATGRRGMLRWLTGS